jgi:hypothetical protein
LKKVAIRFSSRRIFLFALPKRRSGLSKSEGGFDMAKSVPPKEIELVPDAWARFERAAGVVAKTPPQHRVTKKKKMAVKRAKPKKAGK